MNVNRNLFNTDDSHTTINWCDYLNYWIYDYIINSTSCNEYQQFYEKLKILMPKYLPKYDCNIEYPTIEHDKLIKKKKISLYTEILYWMEKAYDSIFYTDDPIIYDKFLGECFKFYKTIKCPDNRETKEEYSNELTKFESNFNSAISFLKKKGKKLSKEGITFSDMSICTLEWENIQENKEAETLSSVKEVPSPEGDPEALGKGSTRSSGSLGLERASGPLEPSGALGLLEQENLNPVGEGSKIDKDTMHEDVNGDPLTEKIPNKVGTIGATVAGSSLFLLMMYKVKIHIFNKYYHFLLQFILHYYENLLITKNYIFKYAYYF
ncbi:hypothetical protein PVIIG_05501 [Plasmodium vivax India VII]|uniref:Uncharacterized protein n=1 Tax=Plasmodium vivax India VII TaxID=1077284 RepID=A0A0J9UV77_PLAVI|nr:hypothetical protein PVIIG_05501 [Plasmodium vivax India VII]